MLVMHSVDQAFQVAPREHFLPESVRKDAAQDRPLSIGYGQTNSQPSTVRRMLTWLDAKPGENVLDVGAGSGWTTALLAYMVEPYGEVYGTERIDELVEFARSNLEKAGVKNAHIFKAQKKFGYPRAAPYDKILVSASISEVPSELLDQLHIGGRIVIPIDNSIMVMDKQENGTYETQEYKGYAFVPLL